MRSFNTLCLFLRLIQSTVLWSAGQTTGMEAAECIHRNHSSSYYAYMLDFAKLYVSASARL